MADSGGLAAAVASGDQVTALTALRDRLAADLEMCESPRDVAALAGRLQSVLAEIAASSTSEEGSFLDDLAKRRRDRQSASASS
ncbi:hypothetical protein G4X40_18605 [Rhodococcus sp. D2-41]|uniref:hypothetical protein n=1 Tax=Speluncibacter jeojiensis TaxID=2710754 RepID=UPI0024108CD2|nr:hypothetical protein [Rhodococcus sp. D2-41]MDG3012157.1 hypothetical protein [Rhodococcus sp. D2-41]